MRWREYNPIMILEKFSINYQCGLLGLFRPQENLKFLSIKILSKQEYLTLLIMFVATEDKLLSIYKETPLQQKLRK